MNETELLFTEVLNCSRSELYLNKYKILDKDKSANISDTLKRRLRGEPIQYILGKTEFMGLEFKVSRDVFIPRPETEILVETVIKTVNGRWPIVNSILEIGVGSGCIAVSLAKFLPNTSITATDISQKSLDVANSNARLNNVADKIKFVHSDLFNNHRLSAIDYGLIVSNPPYIPTGDIQSLQPEVRYEPRVALDGGKDGLDFYRRIIEASLGHLKKGGCLIMEMGFNQLSAIKNIFAIYGDFKIIEVVKDYNGLDRVIVMQKGTSEQ